MEGFADDVTLSIENSIQGAKNVTQIIEEFGNISCLKFNKDKTQAMIFGHKSRNSIPENNNLGFKWVKQIKSTRSNTNM